MYSLSCTFLSRVRNNYKIGCYHYSMWTLQNMMIAGGFHYNTYSLFIISATCETVLVSSSVTRPYCGQIVPHLYKSRGMQFLLHFSDATSVDLANNKTSLCIKVSVVHLRIGLDYHPYASLGSRPSA